MFVLKNVPWISWGGEEHNVRPHFGENTPFVLITPAEVNVGLLADAMQDVGIEKAGGLISELLRRGEDWQKPFRVAFGLEPDYHIASREFGDLFRFDVKQIGVCLRVERDSLWERVTNIHCFPFKKEMSSESIGRIFGRRTILAEDDDTLGQILSAVDPPIIRPVDPLPMGEREANLFMSGRILYFFADGLFQGERTIGIVGVRPDNRLFPEDGSEPESLRNRQPSGRNGSGELFKALQRVGVEYEILTRAWRRITYIPKGGKVKGLKACTREPMW